MDNGLGMSGLMTILAWTPLIDVYINQVINAPPEIRPFIVTGARLSCLIPFITTVQNYLRAMLMRTDTTQPIYQSMGLGLLVSASIIVLGIQLNWSGWSWRAWH